MIHRPEYAKELLKKYLEGTVNPVELARWSAARLIYTDEEIASMTAEILKEATDTLTNEELTAHSEISDEIFVRYLNKPRLRTRWPVRHKKVLILVAMVLSVICLLTVYVINDRTSQHGCGITASNKTISTAAFSCYIFPGTNEPIRIDSNSRGSIASVGNMEINQPAAGMIELRHSYYTEQPDSAKHQNIFITTSPGQQYEIKLPGGSKVRLNASSTMSLSAWDTKAHSDESIEIDGEAYVEIHTNIKEPFILKTGNAILSTNEAAFNIHASRNFTSAALIRGQFEMFSQTGKKVKIIRPGDKAYYIQFRQAGTISADTMAVNRSKDIDLEPIWMKTERVYNRSSLREFAADMSRWYGFNIKNLNCIPENIRISTSICYQAPIQEVFAIFRNAGLTIHEDKNIISFCDPVPNKIQKKMRNTTAYNNTGIAPMKRRMGTDLYIITGSYLINLH